MNPLENIKLRIEPNLHNKLPKKWKKIGKILVLDLENVDDSKKNEIAEVYAEELDPSSDAEQQCLRSPLLLRSYRSYVADVFIRRRSMTNVRLRILVIIFVFLYFCS